MEAGAGIEPANRGFADPCLTTWLSRLIQEGLKGIKKVTEPGKMSN